WPKMDLLFAQQGDVRQWREPFADPSRPLILYAPTFSPSLTSAPQLAREIERLAATGPWNWLVKFHPKMDARWIAHFDALQGGALHVSHSPDLIGLLHAADVMLSDTSSVVAEFLLLDKPVVTFRNSRPGAHLIDFSQPGELEANIRRAFARPSQDREAARAFAAAMHPYRDAHSSERVLDAIEAF